MIEKEHSWQYVPYKRIYESTCRYIRGWTTRTRVDTIGVIVWWIDFNGFVRETNMEIQRGWKRCSPRRENVINKKKRTEENTVILSSVDEEVEVEKSEILLFRHCFFPP